MGLKNNILFNVGALSLYKSNEGNKSINTYAVGVVPLFYFLLFGIHITPIGSGQYPPLLNKFGVKA